MKMVAFIYSPFCLPQFVSDHSANRIVLVFYMASIVKRGWEGKMTIGCMKRGRENGSFKFISPPDIHKVVG
jgi:hypothetical protein